jgi:hypothetical protein
VERKIKTLKPLIAVADLSVATFSSIGVAAITGHLQIARSNLNPFASNHLHQYKITETIAVEATHEGLTRHSGQFGVEGKPVDFRPGKRVPSRKVECDTCGVIDSIQPRDTRNNDFHETPASVKLVSFQVESQPEGRSFIVTVRMGDGSMRTILEHQRPAFNIGERVQLVNGTVIPLG